MRFTILSISSGIVRFRALPPPFLIRVASLLIGVNDGDDVLMTALIPTGLTNLKPSTPYEISDFGLFGGGLENRRMIPSVNVTLWVLALRSSDYRYSLDDFRALRPSSTDFCFPETRSRKIRDIVIHIGAHLPPIPCFPV